MVFCRQSSSKYAYVKEEEEDNAVARPSKPYVTVRVVPNRAPSNDHLARHPTPVQAQGDGARVNSPPVSLPSGNPTANVVYRGKVPAQALRDGAWANSPPLLLSTGFPIMNVTNRGNVPVQAASARVNNAPSNDPSSEANGKMTSRIVHNARHH